MNTSRLLAPVHDLFNHPRLRSVLLRLRLPLGLVAGVLLVLSIAPEWFWPGLVVSAAGALFQLWCFSCIHTQHELAVNGPYMFVRNPMYLARFLLILGIVLMTGSLWLTAAYVVADRKFKLRFPWVR